MKRSVYPSGLCFIIPFLLWFTSDNKKPEPLFYFVTQEDVVVNVYPVYDSNQVVSQYVGNIQTPICKTTECYDVRLDFYWDAIGRFMKFDTLQGYSLTKLDHELFCPDDYAKLNDILTNPNPKLAAYSKAEIVTQSESEEIDGYTGATLLEVKDELIEGAAYTCHTLWHIAHGIVTDSIKKHSSFFLSNAHFSKKLVSADDVEFLYFIINHIHKLDSTIVSTLLSQIFSNRDPYLWRYAIKKIDLKLLLQEENQMLLAKHFSELSYHGQLSLVSKIHSSLIHESLAKSMIENMDQRNSSKNNSIIRLIIDNYSSYDPELITSLLQNVANHQLHLSDEDNEKINLLHDHKAWKGLINKITGNR